MGILFDDNFEEYPLGSFPSGGKGWYSSGGGNTLVIVDPPPIAGTGGLPRDGSIASSSQCVAFGDLANVVGPLFNGDVEFSVMIGNQTPGPQNILQITNTMYPLTPADLSPPIDPRAPSDYTGPATAMMIQLTIEKDQTVSMYIQNGILMDPTTGFPCNSGWATNSEEYNSFSLHQNTWYFFYFQFGLTAPLWSPTHPSSPIMCGGNLSIDGKNILTGKAATTVWTTNDPYIDPTGVYLQPPNGLCNGIQFHSATGEGAGLFLDNVTVNGGQWPHPATPPNPHACISQLVVEYADLNPYSNARISQIVAEIMAQPGTPRPRVRNSQLVVEVIEEEGSGPSGQNWIVKES